MLLRVLLPSVLLCGLPATRGVALPSLYTRAAQPAKKAGPALRLARPREAHLLGVLSVSLYAAAAHSETLVPGALQHAAAATPLDALIRTLGLAHAPEVLPATPLDTLAVAAPSSADAVQVAVDAVPGAVQAVAEAVGAADASTALA